MKHPVATVAAFAALGAASLLSSPAVAEVAEVRGVWVTNVDSDILLSKRAIAEGMALLAEANFNIVYPVVWNKAMTMYPSDHAATVTGVRIDPVYGDRDPLQELLVEAHRHGMEVIPWFEFGFASSFQADGGIIIQNRPRWAALDQDGRLAIKNGFEWLNAFDPEVQEFIAGLLFEVAEKYDVDGVQGDDRLPANPSLAGYDLLTVERYKAEFGEPPPRDIFDEQWVQWRADILSDWLESVFNRLRAIDPNLTVSMSPSYYPWAKENYLQDSYTWTNRGIVDTLHPQAYRYNFEAYKSIIDNLVNNQFTPEQLPMLFPGILVKVGSYRIDIPFFLKSIAYNRANGIMGEVHFFYEGLMLRDKELLRVLVEAPVLDEDGNVTDLTEPGPYAQHAFIPYRAHVRRPGGVTIAPERPRRNEIADNGSRTVLRYRLSAPAAATYRVYADIPWDYSRTLNVEVAPRRRGETRTKTSLMPTEEHLRGMMEIGTVTLTRRNSTQVDVTITQPEGHRLPEDMNIVLLIDRKASPDVEIRRRDLRRWQ